MLQSKTSFRLVVLGALALLLALASVSLHLPQTLHLADEAGRAVPGVLVAYRYEGSRPNPVHPLTYEASAPGLAGGDADGRVHIPFTWHVHRPFPIETHPRLVVDFVYAPALHNGHARIFDRAMARPGLFEVAADLTTIRLRDLGDNPDAWHQTLRNVSSNIERLLAERTTSPREASAPTAELMRLLVEQFAEDCSAFLERYGSTLRTPPEPPAWAMTADELRDWQAMVEQDLSRMPTWGDLARQRLTEDAARFRRSISG